jgi:hypothetical protein
LSKTRFNVASPTRYVVPCRAHAAPRRPAPRCFFGARVRAPPEDAPSEAAPSPCPRAHAKDASRSTSSYHRAATRCPTSVVRPRVPPRRHCSSVRWSLGSTRATYKEKSPTSHTGAPSVPSPCPPPEPATTRSGADPPLSQAKASPPLYPNY